MFSAVRSTRAQAHEAWRDAASLVAVRWHLYVEAEPTSRAVAFAAYAAALDAEETAADAMAEPRLAA
jgi:hypothetical protein